MKAIRGKVRTLTGTRSRLSSDLREVIDEVNPVLRGWGNYFRVGNSAKHFKQVDSYVRERLYLFLSKKHGKSGRGWGERWESVDFREEGLYFLSGTVQWYKVAANAPG